MKHILALLCVLLFSSCFSQKIEVYVCDAGNNYVNPPWQILKFDEDGNNVSTYINTNVEWPADILFLEDSSAALVANKGMGSISKFNLTTGAYLSEFNIDVNPPTRMKIGPDGRIYVLEQLLSKVKRYRSDGGYFGEFTDMSMTQAFGLDWDDQRNLYVCSGADKKVYKFDTMGVSQGAFIDSNLLLPVDIWFDDSDLLVLDRNDNAVKRFDETGAYLGEFISGLNTPEGVGVFPNGNILIGNSGDGSLRLFDENGVFIKNFAPIGAGNLLTPVAITIREVDAVSVDEMRQREEIIIAPTIGSSFSVLFSKPDDIKRIEVYTLLGTLVEEIKGTSWNADSYAEGIYLMTVHLTDGSIHTQKVMVNR